MGDLSAHDRAVAEHVTFGLIGGLPWDVARAAAEAVVSDHEKAADLSDVPTNMLIAAQAEVARLTRIINGYDRTPAEQRAADAEATLETVRASADAWWAEYDGEVKAHEATKSEVARLRALLTEAGGQADGVDTGALCSYCLKRPPVGITADLDSICNECALPVTVVAAPRAELAKAWDEGAEHMAAQEGIAPDRDMNPYL